MNFDEAQTVMNEVLLELEANDLDYSLFQLKKSDPQREEEYFIEIKAFIGMVRKERIRKIAEKHNLLLSETPQGFMLNRNN